ncbi:MAG: hypothetical protein LUC90_05720 [Lachnospiraceae bacterium]|nr:hypothetical protein [Lachnospiraceae bacterium]
MLQYVDAFSCSWNQETGNVVIHFMQKEPVIDDSTGNVTEITNQVSSIVMTSGGVNALLSLLKDVCGSRIPSKDESE